MAQLKSGASFLSQGFYNYNLATAFERIDHLYLD